MTPLAAILLLALTTTASAQGFGKDRGFTLTPPFQRGNSYTITCGYGCGAHDNVGTQDHYALDFDMPTGSPVHPAAPGRVVIAKSSYVPNSHNGFEPYGKFVLIEHPNSYFTMYAHLDSISPGVGVGSWVDIDAPIGKAGMTGAGAHGDDHLHFVLYKGVTYNSSASTYSGGTAVRPEPFAGCTKSIGGDCEGIVTWNTLRRDDFAPEVLVHPNGALDLFTCNRSQRNLMNRSRDAYGTWSPWTNLEGVCASSPSAVRDASGNVFVFVRGLDGKLWTRARVGTWSGWYSIGDSIIGRPTAALDTLSNVVRVFIRKPINQTAFAAVHVASQHSPGNMSFTDWQPLGGSLTNSPAASRRADGRVDVYAAAPDYSLWKLPDNGNGTYTYETWHPQYVSIEGEPAFVAQGTPQWVARSTNDLLLVQNASAAMGATHRPAAARHYYGNLYTFMRNRNNSAADYAYAYNGWWYTGSLGGLVTSELAAVRGNNYIMMFTWGTGGLYYREQSSIYTDSWHGWVNLYIP
ncbi:MAG TPA: peptidoglycan DD-metalloendopeptidase family protein [Kofleriaceae bacterium]|nr:peptidoglycan DD-metalloendopeptidase family protein [Kofleriaceae bacterium]